jgi:hypothetical protein
MMHSFIFQTAHICAAQSEQAELRFEQGAANVTE